LCGGVPVGDVATGDLGFESGGLASGDVDAVEVAENDFGIVRTAKGDVELGYFVSSNGSSVSDGGGDY